MEGSQGRGWGSFWMDGEGTSGILSSPAWVGSIFLGGSINFVYSSFICFNIIFDEYKRISVSDSE